CEAVCPSGVRYGELVETARAQIRRSEAPDERAKKGFASGAARALFERPALMRAAATLLRFAQRTRLIGLANLFGLGRAAALAPEISRRFFRAADQRYDASMPQGLAFFHAGCIMPVAFAQVHRATVRLLCRGQLSVVVPSDQTCCGAIALHDGDFDFTRELAKRNIAAFERSNADVYVVNAAGCGSTLKEYGRLFAGDPEWAARAAAFSKRVRDVAEVLDALDLGAPARSIDAIVTYQEPCHLAHAQRVAGAPRRLLARVPGLRFVEMDDSALCCGSAGLYNLTQPEMADGLQRRKIEAIERTGASVVVTANPGCAAQVAAGLRDAKYSATVKHVVELLDEAFC
ncbi:MAG TPA: heterodisulfide reductase-related iron-sulfur binding cluster, partial [Candidatus Nitrosotalea sp.]|nr:heterodisulfide reductase-related iron-sulfur binding cluster [Candidatus Nitrosotalea sp.]